MKHGFTLLELSIVLVIIGLIIGGITAGQELIRSAELNRLISEKDRYLVAINTFKLKYNTLPGDMDNASSYWPSCDGTPANCNGNGNGQINGITEPYRFWQQLGDSGIINGSYTGITDPTAGALMTGGLNVPQAPGNQIWNIFYEVQFAVPSAIGKHGLCINANGGAYCESTNAGLSFTSTEAKSIDDKIDDGIAIEGNFISAVCLNSDYNFEEVAGDLSADNTYDLSDDSQGCQMAFLF